MSGILIAWPPPESYILFEEYLHQYLISWVHNFWGLLRRSSEFIWEFSLLFCILQSCLKKRLFYFFFYWQCRDKRRKSQHGILLALVTVQYQIDHISFQRPKKGERTGPQGHEKDGRPLFFPVLESVSLFFFPILAPVRVSRLSKVSTSSWSCLLKARGSGQPASQSADPMT